MTPVHHVEPDAPLEERVVRLEQRAALDGADEVERPRHARPPDFDGPVSSQTIPEAKDLRGRVRAVAPRPDLLQVKLGSRLEVSGCYPAPHSRRPCPCTRTGP